MADRTVVVRLRAMVTEFQAAMGRAGASVKDLDKQLEASRKKHRAGFEDMGEGALLMGGALVLGFGMAANAAMVFDKQMSAVKAATGATTGQMHQLREAALQAGKDTAFSATEAARAQTELAKAGLKTKDILGGGLKGALDLAAAGELSVAEAAEIAASAMTQFELKASSVPHVADLLSAAANKAQGTVHDMGMALNQVGLLANQAGWSIEETTGVLAQFANAGLIGSDAGTSLKTMLLRLQAPTNEAKSLMDSLGIATHDAAGNFLGAEATAGQLRKGLSKLTPEQRDAAMATIFGSDAIRAAAILYRDGAEGVAEWTAKVNDAGNASRTAATKMDNLHGDLEKLKGQLETALIQQGSGATGVLRTMAQAADNTLGIFTAMPGPMQTVATVLGLTAAAALLAFGAFALLGPKVREAQAAMLAMGPAGVAANTAMIATAKWAGKAMLALAAFQLTSAALSVSMHQGTTNLNSYGKALEEFGASGKVGGEAARQFGDELKLLKYDLGSLDTAGLTKAGYQFGSVVETLTGTSELFDDSVHNAKRRIGELDQTLAEMVRSGNADAAKAAFERIVAVGREEGVSRREITAGLHEYNGALKEMAESADGAAAAQDRAHESVATLNGGLAAAIASGQTLKDVFDELNGTTITTQEAMINAEAAVDALTESFAQNGATMDINTASGRANYTAALDLIKAARDAADAKYAESGSVQAAEDVYYGYIESLRQTLSQSGLTRNEIENLISAYARIPRSITTTVTMKQYGEAHPYDIGPTANGPLPAPGYKRKANGGVMDFYANGGIRENHIAEIAPAGTMRMWAEPETGGEAYIPLAGSKRTRSRAITDQTVQRLGGRPVDWGGVRTSAAPSRGVDMRPVLAELRRLGERMGGDTVVKVDSKEIARATRRGESRQGLGRRS